GLVPPPSGRGFCRCTLRSRSRGFRGVARTRMSRFDLHATPLSGVVVVERRPLADERGFLVRLFCAAELSQAGWTKPVAQINHTLTRRRGAVRGLHFQYAPHT